MEPGIGRSIKEGFLVANKSWPGIGFFVVSLMVLWGIVILMLLVTGVPWDLLRGPEPVTQESTPVLATPAPSSPTSQETTKAAATENPASKESATSAPDLFSQMAPKSENKPSTTPSASTAPQPAATTTRSEQARVEWERRVGDWVGHAWPVLLIALLLMMAGNLWLTGGEIGYLAKRVTTQQATLSEWWSAGTRSFGRLLAGSLLSFVATAAMIVVVALVFWLLSLVSKAIPAWVLVTIGLLFLAALLIGLVWFAVRVSFWFIVIVMERVGPIKALTTSFRATRGRWWSLAGLGLVMALIYYGVLLPFTLLGGLGNLVGGPVAVILSLIANVVGGIATLYVGFAMMAAYIRFYEDTKTVSATGPSGG